MLVWRDTWIAQAYEGVENATWWRLLHHHQEHCKDLDFEWVKGHGSSRWNNYVDQMASQAQKLGLIDQQRRK
jgi:ribonuclease HI